jgi:hypothetical protein
MNGRDDMMRPEACLRCSGDLSLIHDVGGTYLSRLNRGVCSYQFPVGRQQAPASTSNR